MNNHTTSVQYTKVSQLPKTAISLTYPWIHNNKNRGKTPQKNAVWARSHSIKRTHWSVLGAEKDPQSDSFTFMAVLIVHSESNEERKGGGLKQKKKNQNNTRKCQGQKQKLSSSEMDGERADFYPWHGGTESCGQKGPCTSVLTRLKAPNAP